MWGMKNQLGSSLGDYCAELERLTPLEQTMSMFNENATSLFKTTAEYRLPLPAEPLQSNENLLLLLEEIQ